MLAKELKKLVAHEWIELVVELVGKSCVNCEEQDSFVDVIMDGEDETDENVGEVVSRVPMSEEYLFHTLWILSNNHY